VLFIAGIVISSSAYAILGWVYNPFMLGIDIGINIISGTSKLGLIST